MIKIENLKVSTKGKSILKGLNLEVNRNEIHAIMGPNGSGKSTLVKSLAGYPGYDIEGKVSFTPDLKERDLLSLEPNERALLGLFLSFQYPIELSGVSNFVFLRSIYNNYAKKIGVKELDPIDFRELVLKYMEQLEMRESFLERFVNQDFSGGEKKRNEMLQMLLLKPKLAMLDEIDSGLDVDSLRVVSEAINSLRNESSFIIVTHYNRILDYVKPDFVHVLVNGEIVKSGDASLATEIEKRGYNWI